MYSQEDLNSAVSAGVISADAANALRAHVAASRDAVPADAEHFRLVTGFNDIFVSIGVVILLLAAGGIGQQFANAFAARPVMDIFDPSEAQMDAFIAADRLRTGLQMILGGVLVSATSWLLAEFFTRRKHMALPSILLLLAFVGAVFAAIIGVGNVLGVMASDTSSAVLISASGLITAGAAWLHWRRFMVPITVAAGTGALAVTAIAIIAAVLGEPGETVILSLVLVSGLAIFALAMRWDMTDRDRTTRRSDVAFWLHLLAAPMIAHPLFYSLGVTQGDNIGAGAALAVLAIYIVFGIVALSVDRRALLVSALAYVLIALTYLFREFGAVELNFALTALVIGSALLTLSALWTPIRRAVVNGLPDNLQARLPATA
ncbi:MAG: hypothetical protein CL575_04660 [Altererythrobacter sp.]|nr:hypothetical protein [Altererythrobacter sp.]|tara:strand:+ start:1391 stop:2515 length:1125 start_codon:yes stop_codon:yes gene_type:complete